MVAVLHSMDQKSHLFTEILFLEIEKIAIRFFPHNALNIISMLQWR